MDTYITTITLMTIVTIGLIWGITIKAEKKEKNRSKLIYMASPYSHPKDEVRIENYKLVSKKTAQLVSDGHVVFSPITYGHHLVDFKTMPTDWEFWKNFCLTFLAKCDEMIVYRMEGWTASRGVQEEIEFCKKNNIPITYIDVPVTTNILLEKSQCKDWGTHTSWGF